MAAVSKASQYKSYELREHIYKVPDTYIGSDALAKRIEWLLDGDKIKPYEIDTPVGVEQLGREIISNAGDNVPRSRADGLDPGKVEVMINETTMIVKSGGRAIPVEIHPEKGILAPELIFGHLLTSSNYDGNREGAGRNGFGAKLTNIYSTEFIVMVGDNHNKKTFKKVWYNNMINSYPAEITDGYTGENYVIISFNLDFKRFGMTGYRPCDIALFGRHCVDMANSWKIPMIFNGKLYHFKTPKPYAQMYFSEEIDKAIQFNLYPEGTKLVKKGRSYVPDEAEGTVKPIGDVYLIDTPQEHHTISFINGMMTRDGGIHQESLIKGISSIIIGNLKEEYYGKEQKIKKGKKVEVKPKNERFPLDVSDIRHNISLIVNFYLPNPRFNSQSKTSLSGWSKEETDRPIPTVYIKIPEDILDPVKNWKLIDRLYAILTMKEQSKMSKTDGKKKRHQKIGEHDSANDCGGPNSHNCILMITEGNSADAYGTILRDCIPKGNDILGTMPLRGKLLNVSKASFRRILGSTTIENIKKVLGLREGVDYRDEREYKSLNYGHLLIATDADVDGSHIRGLIYNMMFKLYPTLFCRPDFFLDLRLPVLRVYKRANAKALRFLNMSQYNKFIRENPEAAKWKAEYFKGLGTSTNEHILEDASDPNKFVIMQMDANGPDFLKLVFDSKMSEFRKQWIQAYAEPDFIPINPTRTMSEFINYDMILFSMYDIIRSIPKLTDGFKMSQRKALHGTYKTWKGKWENAAETKVSSFTTKIIEATNYHHGEMSMSGTIISMAQDFVGANNLAYFTQDGQFGTRKKGGKDAASPRYPKTRPNWWLKYVFIDEDLPILQHMSDEGDEVEPVSFFPILPMCLINGAIGIGTGHSTFIPNHNPLDCSKWIKCKIRGLKTPKVYPWYRGFRGSLTIIDRMEKTKIRVNQTGINESPLVSESETDEPDDDETEDKTESDDEETEEKESPVLDDRQYDRIGSRGTVSLRTEGIVEVVGKKTYVKELPIGKWTLPYKKWLEDLVAEKKIKDFRSIGNSHFPQFEIDGMESASEKNLRLVKSFGMSNMVLLDQNNKPKWYHNSDQILEEFYKIRLDIYVKRKEFKLGDLLREIKEKREKIKFYMAVLNKDLIIERRKKADILSDMDRLGIDREQIKGALIINLSEEGLAQLENDLRKIQEEYDEMEKKNVGDIWIKELEEFEEIYRKHEIKALKELENSKK